MHQRPLSLPEWKQVLASSASRPTFKTTCNREGLAILRHRKAGHERPLEPLPPTQDLGRTSWQHDLSAASTLCNVLYYKHPMP